MLNIQCEKNGISILIIGIDELESQINYETMDCAF